MANYVEGFVNIKALKKMCKLKSDETVRFLVDLEFLLIRALEVSPKKIPN